MGCKPLFSIIIPVYNVDKYIRHCVTSILEQRFNDYEIILVNDGSSDMSPIICDKLKEMDARVRIIHKKNEGVSAARKDAAELAQGEYILCVDADDWIGVNCLDRIADVIKETNVDIICYGMIYDDGDKFNEVPFIVRSGYYSLEDIKKEIYPILIHRCDAIYFPNALCGKAIRKSIFLDNILSDKYVTIGEDGACVIPCIYKARSLFVMNEYFYYYRYNSESATKSKKVLNWYWPKIVAEHIKSKIDVKCTDFEEQLYRKITHDLFTVVVTQFYKQSTYYEIVREIRKNLEEEIYKEAIEKCRFKGSIKALAMEFVLKKRIFFPIYLYSKLR